ncbi:hypothetical protein OS493_005807 [Desmophyllum pertusum]|uniref:Uncharacterized protein n=1 Tax=Desmophyllum pertusum TaxID=174260 RepID=A0A9X0CFU2_9CNID|nr:hypothetical protein OS493_005807 [Desmophyllum pertusum]
MASSSAVSSISNAVLGIGRLVEETSGHQTFKHLGPTCLAKFESTQFLYSVAHGTTTKLFLGCDSLDDVFELNGIIYVALTKLTLGSWHFGKSSLISRALEAIDTEKENVSSLTLTSDQLQCLVFCGERTASTRGNRNVCELSTRVYDLLQFDSVLANDESRFPSYFLRNDEKKRFLEEGDFEGDEKPLGAIIFNKDCKLAGVLNFINKHPSPVIVGSALETDPCSNTRSSLYGAGASKDGEKHNETEGDMLVGAAGGVYPLLDPQSKSEVGNRSS